MHTGWNVDNKTWNMAWPRKRREWSDVWGVHVSARGQQQCRCICVLAQGLVTLVHLMHGCSCHTTVDNVDSTEKCAVNPCPVTSACVSQKKQNEGGVAEESKVEEDPFDPTEQKTDRCGKFSQHSRDLRARTIARRESFRTAWPCRCQ